MLRYLLAYRYAVAAGAAVWLGLFLMQQYPVLWLFALVVALTPILLVVLSYLTERRYGGGQQYWPLVIITLVASVGLTSLIEWQALRFFLNIMFGTIVAVLFVLPIHEQYAPRHERKPWRRMMMMLWVFDTYAIVTILFAFGLLFASFPFWILALGGSALFGYSSLMLWHLYFAAKPKKFFLWILLVALCMFEIIWTAHFFPLGHLALGLLVTWVWYIIQLLVRFNLSERGIIWQSQWKFLTANVILYIFLFVFVFRWI